MVRKVSVAALVSVLMGASALAQTHTPAETPGWMSGYWLNCDEAIATSETWVGEGRAVMLGANLSVRRHTHWEF